MMSVMDYMKNEYAYLRKLRADGRQDDLARRVCVLREHGWNVSEIATAVGVARQWLYILIEKYPECVSPADAPPVIDLRPEPEPELRLLLDRAKLPATLSDSLSALWRVNFRDRSGGKSPKAQALDIFLALLLRRGVPYLAIAQDSGVTHRAVIARISRAAERGTLPSELQNSYLTAPKYKESRELHDRIPGRTAFAIFQVTATTYARFYTLRNSTGELHLFNPFTAIPDTRLVDAGVEDFEILHSEEDFARAISDALPDESPVYAVPAHWLYVESSPKYIWGKHEYSLLQDFYPGSEVQPTGDADVLKSLEDPAAVLRDTPAIEWKAH